MRNSIITKYNKCRDYSITENVKNILNVNLLTGLRSHSYYEHFILYLGRHSIYKNDIKSVYTNFEQQVCNAVSYM